MATAATLLLGLALPVTGELSGTWGDTVNVSITALLDTAVAGTTTLSSDADVTLTTTTLAANQARQAIILWTAGGTVTRTITVPAQSKAYIVINKTSSSQSIKIVGVGPTTGVTIVAGTAAFVVWNGVDFVTASVTSTTGILPVANGGTGLSLGTSGGVLAYTATGTLASSAALAASALVIGGGAGVAPSTTTTGTGVVTALGVNTGTAGAFVVNGGALGTPSSGTATNLTGLPLTTGVTGTLPTANGGTALTSFTSTGVVFASSSSVLATGSVLTFDGTMLSSTKARFGTYATFGSESLQVAKANGAGVIGSAYQFAINSKTSGNRAEMILTDGASANAFISYAPSGTAASDRLSFELQGLSVLSLAGNGIVTMAGYGAGAATFSAAGVISSVSDENWKIKDGIPTNPDAMLKKLEPGYWYYNDEKKETFGTERQLGFYAQNVHQAIGEEAAPTPETYVSTDIDGAETTITKPWGYYDRSVLAVVVMSLKNALTTIEQQQTTINNLSARLTKAGF